MGVHDRPANWGSMSAEQKRAWAAKKDGVQQPQGAAQGATQPARPKPQQQRGTQQQQPQAQLGVSSPGGGAEEYQEPHEQPGEQLDQLDQHGVTEVAQQVDARGILARVLRAMADGIEFGS